MDSGLIYSGPALTCFAPRSPYHSPSRIAIAHYRKGRGGLTHPASRAGLSDTPRGSGLSRVSMNGPPRLGRGASSDGIGAPSLCLRRLSAGACAEPPLWADGGVSECMVRGAWLRFRPGARPLEPRDGIRFCCSILYHSVPLPLPIQAQPRPLSGPLWALPHCERGLDSSFHSE